MRRYKDIDVYEDQENRDLEKQYIENYDRMY